MTRSIAPSTADGTRLPMAAMLALVIGAASLSGACAETASDLLPVRAIRPQAVETAPDISLSGEIEARIQSNIAFRTNGKVTARRVEVGQHVTADQVLAVLDPTEQQADVDNAEAALNSAEALLQQAKTTFDRQKTLIDSGFTTRASFDSAQESLKTNQGLVESARASLSTAKEQLSYTELKAGTDGIIVSRSVEAGQVVETGQTVFVLAQDGPRDAVFNIFETLLVKAPSSKIVDVALQADPTVHTSGEVREVSPTVDPSTGTVKVKVGLGSTPPQMTLGAAVIGSGRWDKTSAITLPWSALFEWQGKPAVWVLDDADVVAIRTVEVARYVTGSITLAGGLDGKERVVTAGIQFLHPGQKVFVAPGDGQ